ncbi:helix-turn-helix domain-containing protein [Nocardia sp. NPDC006044]|uniref:helix-turn-helix domain-containing protein n=1 Tax=Nocardia sp. NPDC006044 TaxID=3364306 RepID=UPI0036C4FAA2
MPHRQLGRQLRDMRQEAGLSIAMAAKAIGRGAGTLQRLETGSANVIHDKDIENLCKLYQRPEKLASLKTLAAQRREQSWWDQDTNDQFAPSFSAYLGLEAVAQRLTIYRPDTVPGLLQIGEYVEALDRRYFGEDDLPEDRERRMQVRRSRQTLITRSVHPLEVEVVLDECVLYRISGGPKVMSRQLKYLADLPSTVTVRILPNNAGFPLGKVVGNFTIVDFDTTEAGEPSEPPTVYIESYSGGIHLAAADDVRRYRRAYWTIQRAALDVAASKHLLRQAAKEYAP